MPLIRENQFEVSTAFILHSFFFLYHLCRGNQTALD